jgi:HEAT repeat protein
MRFDLMSFLIGFISAGVIAYVLFRMQAQIKTMRSQAQSQAGSTRQFITNTAEGRYYGDLVKALNAYHIAGDTVNLTDIYVEPRFVRGPEPVDPTAEKQSNVFKVVPQLHDLPGAYAPYNIETLSINDLRAGETHLALLGIAGSGKSTALAVIGLMAANEIEFQVLDTESEQIFEDELKGLTDDEKEKAIKQRQDIQQRAMDHLQHMQKSDEEDGTFVRTEVDFHKMLPILVHLRDIDLRSESYGAPKTNKPLDPAEPIVKALQHRATAITASTLPRMIYRRLNAGTCLMLIDGYEDIPDAQRPEKLAWLQSFVQMYQANFIVVTGPATGYDPLLNVGLTPIFMRAWTDLDFETLVQRWATSWPVIAGTPKKPAPLPEERIVRRVSINNRGRLPLDVTLKAWTAFVGDEQEAGRRGWYDFYVRHAFAAKEARPLLEKVATAILDQGGAPLSRDKIKEIATQGATGADAKAIANIDDLLNRLLKSSLMVDWSGDTYGFRHQLVTGYLGAEALAKAEPGKLDAIVANPAWELALPFAAAYIPLDNAVMQRLGSSPDLLYTSLFSVVNWLPDAPPNAAWRAEIFKRLTAALMAPSQYPAIRERGMAALVTSRDKNILFILKKALLATDPVIRRLACIGLGALGETEAIKDLGPMLGDPDPQVQLAAGLALGSINSETALETMLNGLVEGEQELRQAVAEALAAIPGHGHAVLRDAILSKDMMVRRAAVFGLARIRSAWSLASLYRALLEDEQWYVRNAAEQAFKQAERPEGTGAMRHPEADGLEWLVAWAGQKGEGVPAGINARQVLIRVLQEGDPTSRAAAALTLANLGHVPALKPLYGALRDKDEKVRAAVYEALGELQERLGEKFPAIA